MRLLLLGFTTSRTGDFLYTVALVVYIAEATGSPAWVGVAAFVRMLPVALLSQIAGVLGNRLPARQLLVACDLGQAPVMLIMAGLVAVEGSPVLVLALAGISGALSTPCAPVLTAVTPRLVAEQQLAATNSVEGHRMLSPEQAQERSDRARIERERRLTQPLGHAEDDVSG